MTLTHTASGGDYASITADLPVTVTDDDEPAVVLSETDLTVTEEDAAGSTYTVKLATQPSATVIVTISGHNAADLMLHGTTLTNNQLTFTNTNWGTAQTVTVKAGEDDDAANDTATLTHTASGGDYAGYAGDGHRRRHSGHRAQRDGPHRRWIDLHRAGDWSPTTTGRDQQPAIVLSETDLTVTEERRRWIDLHRQARHTALRHRHCHYLRTQRR